MKKIEGAIVHLYFLSPNWASHTHSCFLSDSSLLSRVSFLKHEPKHKTPGFKTQNTRLLLKVFNNFLWISGKIKSLKGLKTENLRLAYLTILLHQNDFSLF